MTTIVSRAYKDAATASAVVEALKTQGFPDRDISVFDAPAKDVQERMEAALIPDGTRAAYGEAIAGGKAVVAVRVEITPFGAARRAMSICDAHEPVAIEGADGNYYRASVPLQPGPEQSIYSDHRHIFYTPPAPGAPRTPRFSEMFGLPMLSSRKPREGTVYSGRKHFMEFSGLLSGRKPREGTVMPSGSFMSRRFWPQPLLSERKRDPKDVLLPHNTYVSKKFWPADLLSPR